jgi:hypothetical protein
MTYRYCPNNNRLSLFDIEFRHFVVLCKLFNTCVWPCVSRSINIISALDVWSHWKRFYVCKNMQRLWQKIKLFIELKSLRFSLKYEAKWFFLFRKNVILLTFHFCLFLFTDRRNLCKLRVEQNPRTRRKSFIYEPVPITYRHCPNNNREWPINDRGCGDLSGELSGNAET